MATMNGIDISQWQKGLNLHNVKADFVIIKATEGVGFTDPMFKTFIEQAIALGKRIGVYHFARPYAQNFNTPAAEAEWFVRVVQPYIGRVMLVLDWEAERKNDTAWAKAWLDRVYQLTGVKPVFYSYESCVNSYNWSAVAKEYDLWVARYRDYVADRNYDMRGAGQKPSVKWWDKYIMWQWTSSGRLDGWSGNLDLDVFYGDGHTWDAYIVKNGQEITPPEPEEEIRESLADYSDEQLAEMVICGEFGNGDERKKKLGDRYSAVQKLVNQKYATAEPLWYVVKSGDTLSAIAHKFGTTYQKIAMDNHINNPNLIYAGQRLRIS